MYTKNKGLVFVSNNYEIIPMDKFKGTMHPCALKVRKVRYVCLCSTAACFSFIHLLHFGVLLKLLGV